MSLGGSDSGTSSQQNQVQDMTNAQRSVGTGSTSPANIQQILEGLQFARGAYTGQNGEINSALANVKNAGNAAYGTAGQGAGYLGDVLGGKYLNSNPYLDATYQQGANALENSSRSAWGGQDTMPGSGGMQQAALANAQGNLATNIYGGAYQSERANQQQAASMIPGQVSAMTQPGQVQLGAAYQPLQNYLSALSSLNPGQITNKDVTMTSSGTGSSSGTGQNTGGGSNKGLNLL